MSIRSTLPMLAGLVLLFSVTACSKAPPAPPAASAPADYELVREATEHGHTDVTLRVAQPAGGELTPAAKTFAPDEGISAAALAYVQEGQSSGTHVYRTMGFARELIAAGYADRDGDFTRAAATEAARGREIFVPGQGERIFWRLWAMGATNAEPPVWRLHYAGEPGQAAPLNLLEHEALKAAAWMRGDVGPLLKRAFAAVRAERERRQAAVSLAITAQGKTAAYDVRLTSEGSDAVLELRLRPGSEPEPAAAAPTLRAELERLIDELPAEQVEAVVRSEALQRMGASYRQHESVEQNVARGLAMYEAPIREDVERYLGLLRAGVPAAGTGSLRTMTIYIAKHLPPALREEWLTAAYELAFVTGSGETLRRHGCMWLEQYVHKRCVEEAVYNLSRDAELRARAKASFERYATWIYNGAERIRTEQVEEYLRDLPEGPDGQPQRPNLITPQMLMIREWPAEDRPAR